MPEEGCKETRQGGVEEATEEEVDGMCGIPQGKLEHWFSEGTTELRNMKQGEKIIIMEVLSKSILKDIYLEC